MNIVEELRAKWKERLKRFENNSYVAKNMDPRVAMGVQEARKTTLLDCLRELEETFQITDKSEG